MVILAEPTSTEECIRRHREYPIDVWTASMNSFQKERVESMSCFIVPGQKVIDLGCNSGGFAEYIRDCDYTGVDVAESLIEKAKENGRKAFVSPVESLPFPDASFEIAVLGEILEHVFDPRLVLSEAVRVSTKRVVGSTPHEKGNWGPYGIHPVKDHEHHVRCYTEQTLKALLDEFGEPHIEIVYDRHHKPQFYVFCLYLKH